MGRRPGLLPFGNSAFGTPHHSAPPCNAQRQGTQDTTHHNTPRRDTAQHSAASRTTAQHTTAPHGAAQHDHQGILRVDVPDRKIQHGSTSDPRPLRSPTPAAVACHLGRAWVTSTPDERQEALAGAPEIQPNRVLRYMGTDIYLQGAPTALRNLPEVRVELWTQLRPQRYSPDAAMMVLMAKLPSKLLPLASVYRPTAKVHAANDALMVRA